MKLLLTSGGMSNPTLVNELKDLVDKPLNQLTVVHIPTAGNRSIKSKAYTAQALLKLRKLGFKSVKNVDIEKVPKTTWLPILEASDVIYVNGGNTTHLMECFNESGLTKEIHRLLEDRVYVGVSAGSYIATPDIRFNSDEVDHVLKGLHLVDFGLQVHLSSKWFPLAKDEAMVRERIAGCPYTVYAFDDATAAKVDGNKVEIVGEGRHIKVEPDDTV